MKRRERSHDKLHIGYVSPDFCAHAVGGLIYRMFGHHDRKGFKVHCYGLRDRDDHYARRIREDCDVYRDISSASLRDASQQIIDDEIDILIDMSGYTESARPIYHSALSRANRRSHSALQAGYQSGACQPADSLQPWPYLSAGQQPAGVERVLCRSATIEPGTPCRTLCIDQLQHPDL